MPYLHFFQRHKQTVIVLRRKVLLPLIKSVVSSHCLICFNPNPAIWGKIRYANPLDLFSLVHRGYLPGLSMGLTSRTQSVPPGQMVAPWSELACLVERLGFLTCRKRVFATQSASPLSHLFWNVRAVWLKVRSHW
jgi:hypothetical protein